MNTGKRTDAETPLSPSLRLDVWLWAARFFKTRSLAKQAIEAGRVQIDGQACKPSRALHVGVVLTVSRENERYEVTVLGLSDRRGPASVAQTLYSESAESVAKRSAEREQRRLAQAGYSAPATRPDKQARRRLRDLDQTKDLPPWWPK